MVPARTALRIVVDTRATLSLKASWFAPCGKCRCWWPSAPRRQAPTAPKLEAAGCEILVCDGPTSQARLEMLFDELGRRRMTNVLVEGGGRLLGSLFDARLIDEAHVFIAPKLAGGGEAPDPIAGRGVDTISAALALEDIAVREVAGDVYIHGRIQRV